MVRVLVISALLGMWVHCGLLMCGFHPRTFASHSAGAGQIEVQK